MIETDRLRAEREAIRKRPDAERRQALLDRADKSQSSVGGVVSAVTAAGTELQSTAQSLSAGETSRQSNTVSAASEE